METSFSRERGVVGQDGQVSWLERQTYSPRLPIRSNSGLFAAFVALTVAGQQGNFLSSTLADPMPTLDFRISV
jgi:hypothetical protein